MSEPTTDNPLIKPGEVNPSFTKLAMRNMVLKRSTSLKHFALTLIAVIGFFVLVSVIFRG